MKSVIIIRHAKSSWDIHTLSDFERPLNERGHRDAPALAKRLLNKKIAIDAFISSPAKRALTTAAYFAETYKIEKKNIIQIKELYHASVETFFNVIARTDNSYNSIALFSHNPGITSFVNELTNASIDNMPTCGVFAVKVECDNWQEFYAAKKTFWFFDYPKNINP
ncbi:MAG: phosphohistidine phosphatase [Chitinophaga sp.]|jgi:phosphohistidine phosphatase|nr:phosphohistidine phosphatase [Chitinophaga sp.]